MNYLILYDAGDFANLAGSLGITLLLGTVLVIGALIVLRAYKRGLSKLDGQTVVAWFICGIIASGMFADKLVGSIRHYSARQHLLTQSYSMVSGVITDYRPKRGRGSGEFTVQGQTFVYYSPELTNALQSSGSFHEGANVRVYFHRTLYNYDTILKVEIQS